jgi:sigma-B regulation protein RsbU (phosphoserine phosphatase)
MSTYSVPMYIDGEGRRKFYGVVTADLALADLSGQLSSMQLGRSGFALLLSQRGKILAGPDQSVLMQPLTSTLPAGHDPEQWGTMAITAARGTTSTARIPCMDQQGKCVLKMWPLPSTGWVLGVYYSEYEVLAPLRELLLRMALSELAGLVLILVAVAMISRRITRPLTELASITDNVAAGNLDAPMPRVRNQDEVGRLITSFGSMQQNLKQFITRLQQETASRNRLQGEMNAATEIQLAMLPDAGQTYLEHPRYQLWATQRPAKSVGGDFYSYHLRAGRELMIAVGDVSDKGVPAALFMARAMTLLQVLADTDLQPQQYLAQLNEDLVAGNDNCMFVTMFCGILHLDTLRLLFASAGHTAPSLVRNGECRSIAQESGPALALAGELEYPDNTVQLHPGDLLAVYTDGIDEAFNEQGEQFSIAAFNQFLAASRHTDLADLGRGVYAAIDRHAGDTPQSDDITLLLLALPETTLAVDTETRSFSITPGAAVITDFLLWLRARLAAYPELGESATELLLVAEEVFSNILKYGKMPAGGEVQVSLRVDEHAVELCFTDPCQAFDPLREAQQASLGLDSETAAIGGLGVHLFTALTDHQEYQRRDGRNILRLRKLR